MVVNGEGEFVFRDLLPAPIERREHVPAFDPIPERYDFREAERRTLRAASEPRAGSRAGS